MTTTKLAIWNTLGEAFYAPFSLEGGSWKSLARPLVALIVSSILLLTANYFQLHAAVLLITYLLVWASIAWFALDFQRHLLLGAAGCKSESGKWRRYGMYFLILVAVCLLWVLFLGMLLYMVFPGIILISMAVDSPNPWLATGTVVLGVFAFAAASYLLVRFAMILPAVSIEHGVAAKRIWQLSHGQGFRLFMLLILIPGLINGLLNFLLDVYSSQLWAIILTGLLETYFFLIFLSILALCYRELSDVQRPTVRHATITSEQIFNSRALWPVVLILLIGASMAAVLDAVYKIEPGDNIIISRLGEHQRIESEPGINVKIPFVEKVQRVSKQESYKTGGKRQFLTMSKDSLSMKYEAYWRVVNTDAFVRTTAGKSRRVDMLLEQMLHEELRNQMVRLKQEEVQDLKRGDKKKFTIKDEQSGESSLTEVLHDINSRAKDLGVEMTAWSVEVVPPL